MSSKSVATYNKVFWLHLFVTLGAWVMPFLINWSLACFAYSLVMLQFFVFGKCLMNEQHSVGEEDNNTFYAYLLETLGFQPNRKVLKFFIRKVLYFLLAGFTIFYQVYLGYKPLLF